MRDGQDLYSAFSDAEHQLTQTDAPQAQDYFECLKGESYDELTDAEKLELLESLFVIMKSFVNLGYGLDPVNKLIEEFESSSDTPIPVIDCDNHTEGDATDEE